ncbi:hypothetical protein COEREDRAFT_89479 [Coemansia reversa NRRL 1564]|uniref:Uncharacterized protein n=1 Tax=Coemansia reversa (strain ATCC 12441 / NRRL 1564) TaxID=763665 RepID=A0A2G5B3G7_COERN|nr:hypothetical protein COEREDRAFT_89479 [Coemansia reversa NRRL 1564]|eukprot:PIA13544.1 hypothetical protein COEREDRAFT_89479 [Coemansia reversa NRRL 1564]
MASSASRTKFILNGRTAKLVFYIQDENFFKDCSKAVEHFSDLLKIPIRYKVLNEPKTVNIIPHNRGSLSHKQMISALEMLEGNDVFVIEDIEKQRKNIDKAYKPEKIIFSAKNNSTAEFQRTESGTDKNTNDLLQKFKGTENNYNKYAGSVISLCVALIDKFKEKEIMFVTEFNSEENGQEKFPK